MAVRNIRKQLAGVEDLLLGKGKQDQERSAGIVSITKIDIPAIVETIDELSLVDINKYTTAIVKDINNGGTFIYIASNLAINNGITIFNGWTRQTEIPAIVETIEDLSTVDITKYTTAIVKDIDRGGIFIYDSTKVDEHNDGTNFNGWIRQYSGAVNVKWFGAVAVNVGEVNDVTINNTAIQMAIDYAGNGSILIDDAYNLSSPLRFVHNSTLNIVGTGQKAELRNNSTDLFSIDSGWSGVIRDIKLHTGVNGGHIIYLGNKDPAYRWGGIAQSRLSNIVFVVDNPTKSVISNTVANLTFIDNLIDNFSVVLTPTHSSPAFDFIITSGGNVGANKWFRGRITYSPTVHPFNFECTDVSSYIYDNVLDDINFELTNGGMVRGRGVNNLSLNNLYIYDVNNVGSIDNHSIDIGRGGLSSKFVTIRNCHRRSSNLNTGIYDIYLGAGGVVGAVIENCNNATATGYKIHLNDNININLSALRNNTTIDGFSSSTFNTSRYNSEGFINIGKSKIYTATTIPTTTTHSSSGGELIIRPNTDGNGSSLWVRESGYGVVAVQTSISTSVAEIASVTSSINTIGKVGGKMVFVNNRPVWAGYGSAAAPWYFADGTIAYTPV